MIYSLFRCFLMIVGLGTVALGMESQIENDHKYTNKDLEHYWKEHEQSLIFANSKLTNMKSSLQILEKDMAILKKQLAEFTSEESEKAGSGSDSMDGSPARHKEILKQFNHVSKNIEETQDRIQELQKRMRTISDGALHWAASKHEWSKRYDQSFKNYPEHILPKLIPLERMEDGSWKKVSLGDVISLTTVNLHQYTINPKPYHKAPEGSKPIRSILDSQGLGEEYQTPMTMIDSFITEDKNKITVTSVWRTEKPLKKDQCYRECSVSVDFSKALYEPKRIEDTFQEITKIFKDEHKKAKASPILENNNPQDHEWVSEGLRSGALTMGAHYGF